MGTGRGDRSEGDDGIDERRARLAWFNQVTGFR